MEKQEGRGERKEQARAVEGRGHEQFLPKADARGKPHLPPLYPTDLIGAFGLIASARRSEAQAAEEVIAIGVGLISRSLV